MGDRESEKRKLEKRTRARVKSEGGAEGTREGDKCNQCGQRVSMSYVCCKIQLLDNLYSSTLKTQ